MDSLDLAKELKVSALQSLRQFDYPTMPETFYTKLNYKAHELAREAHHRLIDTSQAFQEIKDFAFQKFSQIYMQDY